MRQTVHVCVTAWGYLHLFGVGCISTWLPVCEEQSKWLNSNGENVRFKRVGRTLPNVTAVAFISPGKTTQRIKRDTSMTYERRGIPPLYVRACSHLYRKRGSGHESTFMTVKDNGHTGTNCFPPDYDGRLPNISRLSQVSFWAGSIVAPLFVLSVHWCWSSLFVRVHNGQLLSLFRNQAVQLLPVLSICTPAWRGPFETNMLCTCQVWSILRAPATKKLQLYVGGRSLSLTVMLVEVVCSPF